jgi:hypothetical protein
MNKKYARNPVRAVLIALLALPLLVWGVWNPVHHPQADVLWMTAVLFLVYAFWLYAAPLVVWQDDRLWVNTGLLSKNDLDLNRVTEVDITAHMVTFIVDKSKRLWVRVPLRLLSPDDRNAFLRDVEKYMRDNKGIDVL